MVRANFVIEVIQEIGEASKEVLPIAGRGV
jgi:hypothetical protein